MAKTKKDTEQPIEEPVKKPVSEKPIDPAAFIKVKALVDTQHLKKGKVYSISGADAIKLIKNGILEQHHDIN